MYAGVVIPCQKQSISKNIRFIESFCVAVPMSNFHVIVLFFILFAKGLVMVSAGGVNMKG